MRATLRGIEERVVSRFVEGSRVAEPGRVQGRRVESCFRRHLCPCAYQIGGDLSR